MTLQPLPPLERELWETPLPSEPRHLPNPYRCVNCQQVVAKPDECDVVWSFDWALVECPACGNYLPLNDAEFKAWPEGEASRAHN